QIAARELGVEAKQLHPETETALTRLAWPGNVRQLFVQSGSSVQLTFPIRARSGQWSGLISVNKEASRSIYSP
ncbi:hypothetical protein, partial [Acinetobacter pittii]|uniref:hypothetical protein n=1 Tax=Acinetobacter pittii TaxID=48296 RepID=UPI00227A697D